jgi:predicted TIM-barrel fold metal-dependent hydrolase
MADSIIFSADSHVFEPVNLWETRIDKKYRERGPRFVADYQGKPGTYFGIPKEELVKFKDVHHRDLRAGGYDPVERLKDQAIDGVSGEVLYATYAMQLYQIQDAGLQEAAFHTYNEWMVELCSHSPERLVGLALISVYNVDNAVKARARAARRHDRECAAGGHRIQPRGVRTVLGGGRGNGRADQHPHADQQPRGGASLPA